MRGGTGALSAWALAALATAPLVAQNLTPRAFWPAPHGTKVLTVGYGYQTGDVLTDPSLPIEDVDLEAHALKAGYLQFFNLAGRTASFSVELPWSSTSLDAIVDGDAAARRLSGVADPALRLAINFRGAPSMSPEEFREFLKDPDWILGASLRLVAPTGAYDSDRLANLGTNRWTLSPALGYIGLIRPGWTAEATLTLSIYGDNDDFLGQTLEQSPLAETEFHFLRRLKKTTPDLWLSLDLNFFYGGRTKIDGAQRADLQRNSRLGATVVIPLARGHLLKLAASTSAVTETGGDYTSLLLAYTRGWR